MWLFMNKVDSPLRLEYEYFKDLVDVDTNVHRNETSVLGHDNLGHSH